MVVEGLTIRDFDVETLQSPSRHGSKWVFFAGEYCHLKKGGLGRAISWSEIVAFDTPEEAIADARSFADRKYTIEELEYLEVEGW